MTTSVEEIVLHVGLAKTGSTSIQEACFASKADLLAGGDLYPGDEPSHFHLHSLVSENPHDLLQIRRLGLPDTAAESEFIERYRATLEREIATSGARRVILSSEYILGMPQPDLHRLGVYLRSFAPRVRVLAYLRDPWTFAISILQQYLRNGAAAGCNAFQYAGPLLPGLLHLERGLGVTVEARCHSIDAVADFSDWIGVNLQPVPRVNESMGFAAACLLSHLNALYPQFEHGVFKFDGARDWMVEAVLGAFPNDAPLNLSRATAMRIWDESRDDRREVERRYFEGRRVFEHGFSLNRYGDDDDLIDISKLTQQQIADGLMRAMRMLAERGVYFHSVQTKAAEPSNETEPQRDRPGGEPDSARGNDTKVSARPSGLRA